MKVFGKTAFGAAAIVMASAIGATAATLTIDDIDGRWENAVADPLGGTISNVGTSAISWGTAIQAGEWNQSSYTFVEESTPVVVNEGDVFVLGTFTHNNWRIQDDSLASVDLVVDLTIQGAGAINPITAVFSFDHFETPNQASPCAAGPDPGGSSLCPDLVTPTLNLGLSEVFTLAGDPSGTEYIFNVLGFRIDDGAGGFADFTSFLTSENKNNEAQLLATFQTRDSINPIPLPAAGWMLLAGLGGLGLMRRRKMRDAA